MSVVTSFGWRALPGVENDQPESSESIVLIENSCYCESPGISLENNQLGQIKMLEDRCLGEGPFHFPEHWFGLRCPFPFDFPTVFWLLASRSAFWWLTRLICLLWWFCQWKSYLGIFPDEPSLEVWESEEHLDISNWVQCRPVLYCRDLVRFHPDSLGSDNTPQQSDIRNSKLPLLGIAIELESHKSQQHLLHMDLVLCLVC